MKGLRRVLGGIFLAEYTGPGGKTVRQSTGECDFERAKAVLVRLLAEQPPTPERPRKRQQRVYFLLDEQRGALKIGKSTEPERRRRTLETGHPDDLRLLAVVDGREKDYHRRFAAYRVRREWFRYDGDLRTFVETQRTGS